MRTIEKAHRLHDGLYEIYSGGVLLSHDLAVIVSSAQEGLTSVFGMGTGVAPPVMPPGTSFNAKCAMQNSKFYTFHFTLRMCASSRTDHVYQEQR